MILSTKHLGEIEYQQENIITFHDGLPGFETQKHFIIVLSSEIDFPFHYLQSIDNENIAFVITNPFLYVPDYDFEVPDDIVHKLSIGDLSELSIYSITTIPDEVENTTINLAAPVVVNNSNNEAAQVILQDNTSLKHLIFTKVTSEGDK